MCEKWNRSLRSRKRDKGRRLKIGGGKGEEEWEKEDERSKQESGGTKKCEERETEV